MSVTAVTFAGNLIKGRTLEGLEIEPRRLQSHDRKFWGVSGVSSIYGGFGSRGITVPVILYDISDFGTQTELSDYIDSDLNEDLVGTNGLLIIASESDHPTFTDCRFDGAAIVDGPKMDVAGMLGGGAWAICLLRFTQLS